MLWQNRRFSRYLLKSERVLGMLATPSGDYYIEDKLYNLLGMGQPVLEKEKVPLQQLRILTAEQPFHPQ